MCRNDCGNLKVVTVDVIVTSMEGQLQQLCAVVLK